MSERISFSRYQEMLRDIDVTDEEIAAYSIIAKGDGAFDPLIKPNPDLVDMTPADVEAESAMRIGNGLARWRRQQAFKRRKEAGEQLPVLVSEGDSWFQFPFFIRELIDNLDDDYLIWSIGAAGDTAQNMVLNDLGKGKTEYMQALRRFKGEVRGFLFSAAGNDVIGEDPQTGRPVLEDLLLPYQRGITEPKELVNQPAVAEVLTFLDGAYRKVITDIRAEPGFEELPIFIHGYDYVFPYPWGGDDKRAPSWADKDEWLGKPLDARGIHDRELGRGAIKVLIDQLYARFDKLALYNSHVWVVDCRGAMPFVSDWADEIHGTSSGFAKVAERFLNVIDQALVGIG